MRGTVLVAAWLALLAATPLASAAAGSGPTVTVPQLGPGAGLRYEESFRLGDADRAWRTTARVVTVHEAGTFVDRAARERTGWPVVTQRVRDDDPVQATRCASDLDGAAIQRTGLLERGYRSPFVHAWRLAGGSSATLDPIARVLDQPADERTTFPRGDCPGLPAVEGPLGPGTPPSLAQLLPAPLASVPNASVEGEILADATRAHGRPAVAFEARIDVHLPGPLAVGEARAHPGPLEVSGHVTRTYADGLPGPVRTDAELRIEAPNAPEADVGAVAWHSELTGYRPASEAPENRSSAPADELSADEPLTRAGPRAVPFDLAYPLRDAVETLENDPASRYPTYDARHPDSFLVRATYEPSRAPARLDERSPVEADRAEPYHRPGWTLVFQDADSRYDGVTVQGLRGGTHLQASRDNRTGPGNLAWDRVELEPPNGDLDGPGTPLRFTALPEHVAEAFDVERRVEEAGLSTDRLQRFTYGVAPGIAGATPRAFYHVETAHEVPPGAAESAVEHAVVDAATGHLRVLSREDGRDASVSLAGIEVPGAGLGPEDPEASGRAVPLPDGPAAGVGLAAGATLALLALAIKLALGPLFTRMGRDELLEHPVRRELLDRIDEDPGIHLSGLIEATDAGHGATRYHLRKLREADLVETYDRAGFVRFFPAGRFSEQAKQRTAALRRGSNRRVYEAVRRDPEASIRELAGRLDLAASTVHRALSTLREAGLVDR